MRSTRPRDAPPALGRALLALCACAAAVDAAINATVPKDLTSKEITKRQSSFEDITRRANGNETTEPAVKEGTTIVPTHGEVKSNDTPSNFTEEYGRGAFAVASSNGGSSQAIAQADSNSAPDSLSAGASAVASAGASAHSPSPLSFTFPTQSTLASNAYSQLLGSSNLATPLQSLAPGYYGGASMQGPKQILPYPEEIMNAFQSPQKSSAYAAADNNNFLQQSNPYLYKPLTGYNSAQMQGLNQPSPYPEEILTALNNPRPQQGSAFAFAENNFLPGSPTQEQAFSSAQANAYSQMPNYRVAPHSGSGYATSQALAQAVGQGNAIASAQSNEEVIDPYVTYSQNPFTPHLPDSNSYPMNLGQNFRRSYGPGPMEEAYFQPGAPPYNFYNNEDVRPAGARLMNDHFLVNPPAYPRSAQGFPPNMRSMGPEYPGGMYNSAPVDSSPLFYGPPISVVTPSSSLVIPDGYTTRPKSAYTRIVPETELVYPDLVPGLESTATTCSREGEMYYTWSASHQCLVCACAVRGGQMRPACLPCSGCPGPSPGPGPTSGPGSRPEAPIPTELMDPETTITPINVVDDGPATCSPLPTNQEFQNPLSPCQVCVCQQNGPHDVRITCQDNPQCVMPPDTPTMPPAVVSEPVPLPLCAQFPANVPFPHPSDACRLCRCLPAPEPRVLCRPNPECGLFPDFPASSPDQFAFPPLHPSDHLLPVQPPSDLSVYPTQEGFPFTVTTAEATQEHLSEHYPLSIFGTTPVSFPATKDPVPWPPITPFKHGPLPGPPPHESCRPFPPDVPFDHPWDECRVCMCSEATSATRVSVEVSCYTKPSCCLEVPPPSPTEQGLTSLPLSQSANSMNQLNILDKMCEYKSFSVEFASPEEPCRVCTCELAGAFVVPVCRPSPRPECAGNNGQAPSYKGQVVYIEPRCRQQLPYQQFMVGCNVCSCHSVFNYVVAKCASTPNCGPGYRKDRIIENSRPIAGSYNGFSLVGSPPHSGNVANGVPYRKQNALGQYANNQYSSEQYSGEQFGQMMYGLYGSGQYSGQQYGGGQYAQYPYGAGQFGDGQYGGAKYSGDQLSRGQYGLWQPAVSPKRYPYPDRNQYPYSNRGSLYDASAAKSKTYAPSSKLYTPSYGAYGGGPPGTIQGSSSASASSSSSSYLPGLKSWDVSSAKATSVSGATTNGLPSTFSEASSSSISGSGGDESRCQYAGDMYHDHCQACVCHSSGDGQLYAVCLGQRCSAGPSPREAPGSAEGHGAGADTLDGHAAHHRHGAAGEDAEAGEGRQAETQEARRHDRHRGLRRRRAPRRALVRLQGLLGDGQGGAAGLLQRIFVQPNDRPVELVVRQGRQGLRRLFGRN